MPSLFFAEWTIKTGEELYLFLRKRLDSRIIRECKTVSGGLVVRNNSMSLFISEGFIGRILRTIMPGYSAGGYKRILAKSWSRVIMTLFSPMASFAMSESGDAGGKISLTSTTSYPRALIAAFVERGRLASIRNFKGFFIRD